MFLHSGASFHGHQYSAPTSPEHLSSPIQRRPLIRSAFSTPAPRTSSTYDNPIPTILRQQRPISDHRPKSNPPEHIVRFQEPEVDAMSEDGKSVAGSEISEATVGGGRRRRRSTRTSTAFHLAHPAPTLATQKQKILQVRPKLLLQLQRLSTDSRPKPTIDVLPSFVVVPRLFKKFPRIFRGQGELGANDVIIVKSENYDAPDAHSAEGQDSEDEGVANRDIVAVICQMRKGEGGSQGWAEITLSDGSVWTASPLPNGSFEFLTTDETGYKTTARWVRRSLPRTKGAESTSGTTNYKYNFSIIDPNSRRHPIMASITESTLDIPDFFTSVSKSAGKFPPTSPIRAGFGGSQLPIVEEPTPAERETHLIDESTKNLIQVTGIWVALRQGWSPYFKYNDLMTLNGSTTNSKPVSHGRGRSLSLSPEALQSNTGFNASRTPDSGHTTFGPVAKLRRNCTNQISSRGSTTTGSLQHPVPRRAMSTGTAFMQRAVARRGGNLPSSVASDSEGEVAFHTSRVTIEGPGGKLWQRMSLPPTVVSSPTTPTPETTQIPSSNIALNNAPNLLLDGNTTRSTSPEPLDMKHFTDIEDKPKTSRWKVFANIFRRSSRRTLKSDERLTPSHL